VVLLLLFPILALSATRLGRGGTVVAIVLLLIGITSTYFTAFERNLNQATGALTLLRATPEFLLGCLLQRLAERTRLEAVPWMMVVAALALLWAVSYWTVLPVCLVALPLFAALILAGSTKGNAISRTLGWRPFVAAGSASYSLYLMQAPVQKGARVLDAYLATSRPLQDAAIVLAYVCLLGFGSALVHLYVENPSRRWLRRVIDRWLPRPPVALPVPPVGQAVAHWSAR